MSGLAKVTMAQETWETTCAVLLESAIRLSDSEEDDKARELLTKIVPTLAHASGSARMERLENRVREHVGEYAAPDVRGAGRLLVEFIEEEPEDSGGERE